MLERKRGEGKRCDGVRRKREKMRRRKDEEGGDGGDRTRTRPREAPRPIARPKHN